MCVCVGGGVSWSGTDFLVQLVGVVGCFYINTVGGGRTTSLSDTDFLVQRVGVVSCFYSCVCMCVWGWVGGWGGGGGFLLVRY